MKHLNTITETIIDMQNKTTKSSKRREKSGASSDYEEDSEELASPLDVEKLKSIAELAKRLR